MFLSGHLWIEMAEAAYVRKWFLGLLESLKKGVTANLKIFTK